MTGLVLYSNRLSSNSLKARIMLAELRLAHEVREVPLARPRPDWYLALNPVGGVPAIRDGATVVSESHAILRYLARREGRADLYPDDPAEAAAVDEFLDRFHTVFRPAFFRHERHALGYARDVGGPGSGPVDAEAAAEAAAAIRPTLAVLDAVVGPDAAVLGRYTIADVALAPVLFRTTVTGLDLSPHPALRALRETLLARPAFAAADPVT